MTTPIGHFEILRALGKMTTGGTLPHALLFVGPSHVGKTTVALWLAQRLLCDRSRQPRCFDRDPDTESSGPIADSRPYTEAQPCGVCPTCVQVSRGTHPDVMRIGDGGAITVETVRAWTSAIASSALFGGWKIGIVEGADRFTESAANACLKTIEEPPSRTLLVLTTEEPRSVLPTIASRCATIRCRRVPNEDLLAGLADRGVALVDAGRFARAADGCPGLALTWASTPDMWALQEKREQLARDIIRGSYAERVRHIERFIRGLPEDRVAVHAAVGDLLRAFRGIAREIVESVVGGACDTRATISMTDLVAWMNVLVRAPRDLTANVAPRLVLESIVLTYP